MKVGSNVHPAEDVLERYSLGNLGAGEVDAVEEHLLVCVHCQEALEAVECSIAEIKTACEIYRRRPIEMNETLFDRIFAFLAPVKLVYAGAAAALFLAVALPVVQNRTNRAPATVAWDVTYRGSDSEGTVESAANRPLHFVLNTRDLATNADYRLEVVDQNGAIVWSGTPKLDGRKLVMDSPDGLRSGLYWVRLYGAGPNPIREFGLRLN